MKRLLSFLAAAVIALSITVGAPARELYETKVTIEAYTGVADPRLLVLEGFQLAAKHYATTFGNLIADYPAEIVFMSDEQADWLGCYGGACYDETEPTRWDNYKDPAKIDQNKVYINVGLIVSYSYSWGIDPYAMLVYVMAHELGHHMLTVSGVSLEWQHSLMGCGPDNAIARALKLDLPNRCGARP